MYKIEIYESNNANLDFCDLSLEILDDTLTLGQLRRSFERCGYFHSFLLASHDFVIYGILPDEMLFSEMYEDVTGNPLKEGDVITLRSFRDNTGLLRHVPSYDNESNFDIATQQFNNIKKIMSRMNKSLFGYSWANELRAYLQIAIDSLSDICDASVLVKVLQLRYMLSNTIKNIESNKNEINKYMQNYPEVIREINTIDDLIFLSNDSYKAFSNNSGIKATAEQVSDAAKYFMISIIADLHLDIIDKLSRKKNSALAKLDLQLHTNPAVNTVAVFIEIERILMNPRQAKNTSWVELLDRDAISNLTTLISTIEDGGNKAVIVVTGSWCHRNSILGSRELFKQYPFSEKIIDFLDNTTYIMSDHVEVQGGALLDPEEKEEYMADVSLDCGEEIELWMDDNKNKYNITNFVILGATDKSDSHSLLELFNFNFVKCNEGVFSKDDLKKAIHVITNQNENNAKLNLPVNTLQLRILSHRKALLQLNELEEINSPPYCNPEETTSEKSLRITSNKRLLYVTFFANRDNLLPKNCADLIAEYDSSYYLN